MSNLRWHRNDENRVWTLIVYSETCQAGRYAGYVFKKGDGWGVYHSGAYMTTLADLDEAKALLQTLAGASNV